jgi:hypothetical protein
MNKINYPDKIGLFDIKSKYEHKLYNEAYYYYKNYKLKLYLGDRIFYFEIVYVSPIGTRMLKEGVCRTLQECINNINEWCFLNDHLFLPGK